MIQEKGKKEKQKIHQEKERQKKNNTQKRSKRKKENHSKRSKRKKRKSQEKTPKKKNHKKRSKRKKENHKKKRRRVTKGSCTCTARSTVVREAAARRRLPPSVLTLKPNSGANQLLIVHVPYPHGTVERDRCKNASIRTHAYAYYGTYMSGLQ